ncbi:acyltransferase family protein [Butyrivibrio sp. YAB3001]|uniref:acyltransferase family protein n=1 Tax=Butyrivibrio sp. YAB3001 TaxID=1520812 RepID=UPI0008F6328D|nr:acyltransferase [Butyrivibrio sp. YAB3001]SFC62001.1 Fucose 4-O-acetylase [Butyrivibrio sp. YAB3001]
MNDKSSHYDLLKFFATILVVVAHSSRMYTGVGVIKPANASFLLGHITQYIYSFHMPMFIAVSGMVYGLCIDDLNKYKNSIKFIKNKVIRLLVPYLFFGFFYVAPIMTGFRFTDLSYLRYCMHDIVFVKDARHLWYVIVLFEIYIISMLFKPAIQGGTIKNSIVIATILLSIALVSFKFPILFQISNLGYYLIFFYFGVLYNRYYEKANGVIKNYICIIICLALTALVFQYSHVVIKIIKAITGSLAFIGITSYVNSSFLNVKIVNHLNKDGFGIYLFHPMIIYVLFYYFGDMDISPIILCLTIAIASYVLSAILTDAMRKFKLNILIGE